MRAIFLAAFFFSQMSLAASIECSWRGNSYDAIAQTRGLDTCFQEILEGKVCFTGNLEEVFHFISQEVQPRAYELSWSGKLMYYPLVTNQSFNPEAQTISYDVDQAGYQRVLTISRCESGILSSQSAESFK